MAATKQACEPTCAQTATEIESRRAGLHAQLKQIWDEVTERYRARYLHYMAYDNVEAASLELLRRDECRAECYWAMARSVEMHLEALGKRWRKSELGREYEQMRRDFDAMTDRYDALYYEEVRFLALRREATEQRLELLRRTVWDRMAVEDFCVTMQSSL